MDSAPLVWEHHPDGRSTLATWWEGEACGVSACPLVDGWQWWGWGDPLDPSPVRVGASASWAMVEGERWLRERLAWMEQRARETEAGH